MNRKTILWLLVGVLTLFTFLRLNQAFQELQRTGLDFTQDYVASRYLLQGKSIYDRYTPNELSAIGLDQDRVIQYTVNRNAHPPFVAWVMIPLAILPFWWAIFIWTLLTIGFIATGWILIAKGFNLNFAPIIHFTIILCLLNWEPVWIHILYGQINIFVWILCILSWYLIRQNKDIWSGIIIAIAVLIKLYPIIFIMYFVINRRWKSVIASGVVLAIDALVNMQRWYVYITDVSPTNSVRWSGSIINISLKNMGLRLFGGISDFPTLLNIPFAALATTILLYGIAGIAIIYGLRKSTARLNDQWSMLMAAVVMLSPIMWDHGLIFLLMPIVVLLKDFSQNKRTSLLFITLIIIILGGLSNRDFVVFLAQTPEALRQWWYVFVVPIIYVPLLAFWATWYCVIKHERSTDVQPL